MANSGSKKKTSKRSDVDKAYTRGYENAIKDVKRFYEDIIKDDEELSFVREVAVKLKDALDELVTKKSI
jgi:hypothetical protein